MTPLYGHVSEETAYVNHDYPYGSLRCTIKFWLEHNKKKGWRFVSQTINPKNGRINAPKKSTYAKIAGCMYLDEENHCTWACVSEYSDYKEVLSFVQRFLLACDSLLPWAIMKVAMCKQFAAGTAYIGVSVNGVPRERPEDEKRADMEKGAIDLAGWEEVLLLLKANRSDKQREEVNGQ